MGGRGSNSGVGGATASANAMLPSYDTKALAKRMLNGLPELSGTLKQVRWASDIRYEARQTMFQAITTKYNIGKDTYQDIANGKKSMQDGVKKAYNIGFEISGNNKTVAKEWAERRAKTYKDVSDDLQRVDTILQGKTESSWWIKNRINTAFREYVTSGKTVSEMEKSGWFKR